MAINELPLILRSDTLAEGRDKLNSAIDRLNEGEFNDVKVFNNMQVLGTLTANIVNFSSEQQSRYSVSLLELAASDEGSPQPDTNDGKSRGVLYNYVDESRPSERYRKAFFGVLNPTDNVFTFLNDVTVDGGVVSLASGSGLGTISAKIQASDILNVSNLVPSLSGSFVDFSTNQNISGTKTFNGFLILGNATQGTSENHAVPARRTITGTDGILVDGTIGTARALTSNKIISLSNDVVRTFGAQTIVGDKTFSSDVTFNGRVVLNNTQGLNIVFTNITQDIPSLKTFRPAANQDGIRLSGRSGGTGNFHVSLATSALSANRTVTFSNSDTTITPGTTVSVEVPQTITSAKTFTQNISFSDSALERRGITGIVGGNDNWFIGAAASDASVGFIDIGIGNNATESIFVTQYSGNVMSGGTIQRRLTLLASDGNTYVPQNLFLGFPTSSANHAVRADRLISTGSGLSGGGNLTDDRTLTVDNTVLRTTGNFTVDGAYTFSSTITGNISGSASSLSTPRLINGEPFDGTEDINIDVDITVGGGAFYEANNTVTQNYTVSTGKNALSIGPISIQEGIIVTVPSGSTWVVV